ncbi:putative HTH-type transcriptional regulator YusO [Corynebacterium pelargi]|uniref:Putative HTH-type transcriptional regulator YusO n=2 Tax=Corynebacterium pelargi TaxID=1471400 RepID=A0A410WBR3_9CORY|nr:putative HTH-type transcriptional regulator YusO [Corynebacterium pelargi]
MAKIIGMTQKTPLELAQYVRPALTKLYVLYFRIAEQSDLTGPQLTILTRLAEDGDSRISHIANAEGIRMPTASNALHQLEQRGMVRRVPDKKDRRGVRVTLTDKGRRELKRVGRERDSYIADMLDTLPPEKFADAEIAADVIRELANTYQHTLETQHNREH